MNTFLAMLGFFAILAVFGVLALLNYKGNKPGAKRE